MSIGLWILLGVVAFWIVLLVLSACLRKRRPHAISDPWDDTFDLLTFAWIFSDSSGCHGNGDSGGSWFDGGGDGSGD